MRSFIAPFTCIALVLLTRCVRAAPTTAASTTQATTTVVAAAANATNTVRKNLLEMMNAANVSANALTALEAEHTLIISRQCSCAEAEACRKEAMNEMKPCLTECDSQLKTWGNQTETYLECFEEHVEGISEAEDCLYHELASNCAMGGKKHFIERPDWDKYTEIGFDSDPHKAFRDWPWLEKPQKLYSSFQKYFFCTKNCMHAKLRSCFQKSACTIRLPPPATFQKMMVDCTRKNTKIAQALLHTCQCLAFKRHVKELVGSCAILGNQLFVDHV